MQACCAVWAGPRAQSHAVERQCARPDRQSASPDWIDCHPEDRLYRPPGGPKILHGPAMAYRVPRPQHHQGARPQGAQRVPSAHSCALATSRCLADHSGPEPPPQRPHTTAPRHEVVEHPPPGNRTARAGYPPRPIPQRPNPPLRFDKSDLPDPCLTPINAKSRPLGTAHHVFSSLTNLRGLAFLACLQRFPCAHRLGLLHPIIDGRGH